MLRPRASSVCSLQRAWRGSRSNVPSLSKPVFLALRSFAVADILGEAAAQEEWTVQQMLLEAAKLEVQVLNDLPTYSGNEAWHK